MPGFQCLRFLPQGGLSRNWSRNLFSESLTTTMACRHRLPSGLYCNHSSTTWDLAWSRDAALQPRRSGSAAVVCQRPYSLFSLAVARTLERVANLWKGRDTDVVQLLLRVRFSHRALNQPSSWASCVEPQWIEHVTAGTFTRWASCLIKRVFLFVS